MFNHPPYHSKNIDAGLLAITAKRVATRKTLGITHMLHCFCLTSIHNLLHSSTDLTSISVVLRPCDNHADLFLLLQTPTKSSPSSRKTFHFHCTFVFNPRRQICRILKRIFITDFHSEIQVLFPTTFTLFLFSLFLPPVISAMASSTLRVQARAPQ